MTDSNPPNDGENSPGDAKSARDGFLAYLRQVAQLRQFDPDLLRNILFAEVKRRKNAGEQPHPDDFTGALPEFAKLVYEVFRELSATETTHNGSEGIRTQTGDYAPPVAKYRGEFEIIRQLGQGAMGVVYEARHRSRGDRVALKTLPTQSAHAQNEMWRLHSLQNLKNEFRYLESINHPNLVGLHSLEEHDGQYFLTMELIDGEDFFSYVRGPSKQVNVPRLRSALSQLIKGIFALHNRNIIHRDLKPSNVMVDRGGQVKILDCGLALETNCGVWDDEANIVGTPAYIAPEQVNGRITFASDWYAVGVMLYEALMGHRPFRSRGVLDLYREKQERDVESIVGQPNVPEDLARLCMRLLNRNPNDRFNEEEIVTFISFVEYQHGSINDSANPLEISSVLIKWREEIRTQCPKVAFHFQKYGRKRPESPANNRTDSSDQQSQKAEPIVHRPVAPSTVLPFDQMNNICQLFKDEWTRESRNRIDDYVNYVDEKDRPTLSKNLLAIDIEKRKAEGEKPTTDEYLSLAWLPPTVTYQIFSETASSRNQKDKQRLNAPAEHRPALRRLGDFELMRELGRGGMGAVFEAIHVQHGHRVALKTLPTVHGVHLHSFKQEFRSLADVNHPNLVGVHALETDGSQWFLTMDLIDGVGFNTFVRPDGVLNQERLYSSLSQLISGVATLHEHQIVHRDLKPSNVMITHEGTVVVLGAISPVP